MNINAINENGTYIKDCSMFIDQSMILECGYNTDLVRQSAILEGAKIDWLLKNLFNEGEDYKGLKSEVKKDSRS